MSKSELIDKLALFCAKEEQRMMDQMGDEQLLVILDYTEKQLAAIKAEIARRKGQDKGDGFAA